MAERCAFVTGSPIGHSRSPIIHRHWLEKLGIEGSYDPIELSPADFEIFIDRLPESGFAGGNVTIPHKEAAWRKTARRDEAAELIGAVNTLWIEDGVICGSNTDAYGFAANLDAAAPRWREGGTAVMLGAGGAARAILHALKDAGFSDIRLLNRTRARAEALASAGNVSVHDWEAMRDALDGADLLVNTTSLGMDGAEGISIDLSPLSRKAIVTDIVYVPLKTPLLALAESEGLKTVDGLGMLLHQATPGFERWFGVRPEVTAELHALVVADLEAHS
ncbi:shikimate dehydrogenase [Aquamicrobium sp. LC103]|uniref:shikimate dehydrogenase n=1 Tax=Aquamicrobium sp. LC103 TaxID=1120658 RepID=UPI00063E8825|nr:shikimate dehydrogenase [Aquamicrobium sp. LC103]TKT82804.1 shikimate dehydrogenase [Aquamicrobium sp. LC103]